MHIIRKYYFIDKFDTNNIDNQKINTGIIYRNYNEKNNLNTIIEIKNYCKKKGYKFFLSNNTKLAKMNLAIRGIAANIGEIPDDTFENDQHKDLKADYIMANPPFNLKDWRAEAELLDDPRWMGYDVPPKSNANYAWILNIVSKLSELYFP